MSFAVPTLKEFALLDHYLTHRGVRTYWGHPLMLLVGKERHTNLVRLLSECRGQFDSILVVNNSDDKRAVTEDSKAEACLNVLLQGSTHYTPEEFLALGDNYGPHHKNKLVLVRGTTKGGKLETSEKFMLLPANCRDRNMTLVFTSADITVVNPASIDYCDVFVGGTDDTHCYREYQAIFSCCGSLRQMLEYKMMAVESESLLSSATSWLSSWFVSPPPAMKTTDKRCLVWRNAGEFDDVDHSLFYIKPRPLELNTMQPLLARQNN